MRVPSVAHASAALAACVALSAAPSPAQQTSPAPPSAAAPSPSQPTPPLPEPAAPLPAAPATSPSPEPASPAPAVPAPASPAPAVPAPASPPPAVPEPAAPPPAVPAPASPPPAVEAPTRWALEVDLRGAWGFMVQPSVDHTGETSSRNGGPAVGVSALFRTAYFLAPLLDVYFQPLYRNQYVIDLGSLGGPTPATGSLRTLGVVGGAAFDFWRLRLAAGIGAYQMQVHTTLNGRPMRTSEWDMSYVFSAGGFVWDWDRIRVGLESRLGVIVDGGTTFFSVGIVVAGDAVRW